MAGRAGIHKGGYTMNENNAPAQMGTDEFELLFEIDELGVCIDSWEDHKRGKNYLASLTGHGGEYKFKREFLNDMERIDEGIYFPVSSFESVRFLEVVNAYYSGGGNKSKGPKDGRYEIQIRDDGIYGKRMTERELIIAFKTTDPSHHPDTIKRTEYVKGARDLAKALKTAGIEHTLIDIALDEGTE